MRKCFIVILIFTVISFSNADDKVFYGFSYGRYMTSSLPSMWQNGNVFGVIASLKSEKTELLMPILISWESDNDPELGELEFKYLAIHSNIHYYPIDNAGLFLGGGLNINRLNYHKKSNIYDGENHYVTADVIFEYKFGVSAIAGYQTSFGLFFKTRYTIISGFNAFIFNAGFLW